MERSIEKKITETFLALTRTGKAEVMASVANRETVGGRGAYLRWDGPVDGQLLRRSNESLHRLTGYIVAVPDGRTTPDYDASFVRGAIEVLAQRGRHELERLAAHCLACSGAATHNLRQEATLKMK